MFPPFWLVLPGLPIGWVFGRACYRTSAGALGGLIGFMLSGIVHYNWGDSEVVMILYLIMGLNVVVERQSQEELTAGFKTGLV